MGRKRQEGITTNPRYKIKAYSVGMGIGHGNVEMAKEYAEALTTARASGVGLYKNAYVEIKPVLMDQSVPSALWGLYKAFINEVVNKVQRRKIMTVDEVVDKWVRLGLDDGALRACAEAVGVEAIAEVPVPAQKTD